MDDIWIISWFNHIAFDANPIWKSPIDWIHKVSSSSKKIYNAKFEPDESPKQYSTTLSYTPLQNLTMVFSP